MHPAARSGYLYLIASAWQTDDCTVSGDPLDLAVESGLGDELWVVHGPRIMRKFYPVGDRMQNDVIFAEWLDTKAAWDRKHLTPDELTEKRSAAGKAGNEKRWANRKRIANAIICDEDLSQTHRKTSLTVTRTVTRTGTEKVQKPSRADRTSDPRHSLLREELKRYAEARKVLFVWDASEGKALDLLLKATPSLTMEIFQTCLFHRSRSTGTPHGERPRTWLPHILKYQQAPLNEFNKTETSNGNRHSKTGGNIDAAAQAFAILERQERDFEGANAVQSETFGGSEPGDVGPLLVGPVEVQPGGR